MTRLVTPMLARRGLLSAFLACCLGLPAAARARSGAAADPASDEPEGPPPRTFGSAAPPSYEAALASWRNADDVNAWIGGHFEYDRARALQLSETQRRIGTRLPILEPAEFYRSPRGVCVDLARFAVETLQRIDPDAQAQYLMIEFDPMTIAGHVLRRHWVAIYRQAGQRYVMADSKRPGKRSGPYDSVDAFIEAYARYRGRGIVAWHEVPTFERRRRQPAAQRARETDAAPP